jgi:hypothetical protein
VEEVLVLKVKVRMKRGRKMGWKLIYVRGLLLKRKMMVELGIC